MSTIAVNAITDANGGSTTSINGTTPNAYNTVGKNLIINGAMQIAQRGTSETGITTSGYKTVDRFKPGMVTLGTWTSEQSTDAPDGFSNSFKHTCTTADASPATGDIFQLWTGLEGQTLQQLAKGTTSAKSITLSFWVKCNKTGTAQVNVRDYDNNRMIGNTFTINTADTWEKKSITFDADTTGTLDNDNTLALGIEWNLDAGTTFTSGAVPTSWETTSTADRAAGVTLALGDATSNYFSMTGVQLEVGESATEFEHRPYTTELSLCQRYYWRQYFSGANVIYDRVYWNGAGNNAIFNFPAPAGMRINAATVTCSPTTNGTGVTFTYHPHGNIIVYRVSASGDNYLYAQDLSINAEL
jgi:hypothetical protein